jgi:hypothetical protein
MSDLQGAQNDDQVNAMNETESREVTAMYDRLSQVEADPESLMLKGIDPGEPWHNFPSEETARAHANGLMASSIELTSSAAGLPEGSQKLSLIASASDYRQRAITIRAVVAQSICVRLLYRQVSSQHKYLGAAIAKMSAKLEGLQTAVSTSSPSQVISYQRVTIVFIRHVSYVTALPLQSSTSTPSLTSPTPRRRFAKNYDPALKQALQACLLKPIHLSEGHPDYVDGAEDLPVGLAKGCNAYAMLYHPEIQPVVVTWYCSLLPDRRPQAAHLSALVRYELPRYNM